ncbi:MAG: hypothetical protein RJA49_1337, partial [Actinomycetota bacterium]
MTVVNGGVSFWMREQPAAPARAALKGNETADVAIIGGGLSGLWAAYHLTEREPGLRVVVLEAERVGWGASGRNGGWLSQLVPGNRAKYAAGPRGADGVARLQTAMLDGIADVVRVADDHGLQIDAHRGGNLVVATTRAGLSRLHARMAADLHHGLPQASVHKLDAAGAAAHIDVAGM